MMAIPHAQPGEVINVQPLGKELAASQTRTLFKSDNIEIIRLVMAAGKVLAEHKAPRDITVQCLEGVIAFTAMGKVQQLSAGQMLCVAAGEPHSVECLEPASFLLTLYGPK
ncbi:cupin domain-containing protein [Schlesneria sp. DSM 10557]|uniref:cupin domain-containing protein n=1 Tax=Schlesneria sp. DSM 10557 TaxID=3044399 RepID=UPI00359FAD8C